MQHSVALCLCGLRCASNSRSLFVGLWPNDQQSAAGEDQRDRNPLRGGDAADRLRVEAERFDDGEHDAMPDHVQ
jgi:hypothetical protein